VSRADGGSAPPLRLVVIFLAVTAIIVVLALLFYDHQRDAVRRSREAELAAIADLKVRQIAWWREQRIAEAEVLLGTPPVARLVDGLGAPSASRVRLELAAWLRTVVERFDLRMAVVYDRKATARLVVPDQSPTVGSRTERLVDETMRTGRVALSDLLTTGGIEAAYLDLVVPLHVRDGDGSRVAGALLLRVDPRRFLFPLVRSWPTPTGSGETHLVRIEGNDVVYLSELRGLGGATGFLRVKGDEAAITRTAARGFEGVIEGDDYRGTPVLATVRRVPDSPWRLIVKVDRAEVYAPMRARARYVGVLSALAWLALAAAIAAAWRHQQAALFRHRYQAEIERKALFAHYGSLARYANDVVVLTDPDGAIVDANDRAVEAYGYSLDDLRQLNLRDLLPPELRSEAEDRLREVAERNGLVFETVQQRRYGARFPVEVSTRPLDIEGQRFFQSIIRDVSERKRAEAELRRLNRALTVLSESNRVVTRAADEVQLLGEVCRLLVSRGGYALAWVGYAEDDPGQSVVPVARGATTVATSTLRSSPGPTANAGAGRGARRSGQGGRPWCATSSATRASRPGAMPPQSGALPR
jgi:PAS domain S-box-containing protein